MCSPCWKGRLLYTTEGGSHARITHRVVLNVCSNVLVHTEGCTHVRLHDHFIVSLAFFSLSCFAVKTMPITALEHNSQYKRWRVHTLRSTLVVDLQASCASAGVMQLYSWWKDTVVSAAATKNTGDSVQQQNFPFFFSPTKKRQLLLTR